MPPSTQIADYHVWCTAEGELLEQVLLKQLPDWLLKQILVDQLLELLILKQLLKQLLEQLHQQLLLERASRGLLGDSSLSDLATIECQEKAVCRPQVVCCVSTDVRGYPSVWML